MKQESREDTEMVQEDRGCGRRIITGCAGGDAIKGHAITSKGRTVILKGRALVFKNVSGGDVNADVFKSHRIPS